MAFGAGELTDQLMLQERNTAPSEGGHGVPKLGWKDVRWIWCKVDVRTAGEQPKATGQVELGIFTIKTSWLGGRWITAKMRGRWLNAGGQLLEIIGLRPVPAKDELYIEAAAITV
jgi:head-tail adaptor